jgi:uncharacterized protein YggE
MKFHVFLAVLSLITSPLFAQVPTIAEVKIPYIEVTGVAELEIVPDQIYIKITIQEKYVNKTKVTIEAQEEKMRTGLKEIGLNPSDLFLSDASGTLYSIRRKSNDMLTKKNYTLKVSDAATVGKVFKKLDELEIDDASILRVDHSKIDSIRKEVRILAIKAAKHKADYLLAAIGEQTGKPWIVNEAEERPVFYWNENMVSNNSFVANNGIMDTIEEGPELQFETMTVRSSIYVKFAIK